MISWEAGWKRMRGSWDGGRLGGRRDEKQCLERKMGKDQVGSEMEEKGNVMREERQGGRWRGGGLGRR
jgi:hypothetical protein